MAFNQFEKFGYIYSNQLQRLIYTGLTFPGDYKQHVINNQPST